MTDIVAQDSGEGWSLDWLCENCGAICRSYADDLEADEFKVSGHHFTGTAVCERKLYLICPTCKKVQFLDQVELETVPYLLNQQGEAHYEARRKRERDAVQSVSE